MRKKSGMALNKQSCSITDIENGTAVDESKSFYIKTIEFYRQENEKNEQMC